MFGFHKKKCTEETVGMVPVGFSASSAIENIEVGANVRVKYNPNKPKQGYLPDNDGYHFS